VRQNFLREPRAFRVSCAVAEHVQRRLVHAYDAYLREGGLRRKAPVPQALNDAPAWSLCL
jgi:hypothetical protein